jgi:hypothetical protein
MRAGVDVIYQGTLAVGDWSGRPDFLVRVAARAPGQGRPIDRASDAFEQRHVALD